jgi:uncharacterized protein (UPF0210 family)
MSSPESTQSSSSSRSIGWDESMSDRSFDPDSAPSRQDRSYDASLLIYESDDEIDNSMDDKDSDGGDSCKCRVIAMIEDELGHNIQSERPVMAPEHQVLQTISAQVANSEIRNLRDVASKEMLRLRSEIEKLTRKNLKLRQSLSENEEKLSKSLTLVNRFSISF